MAREHVAVKIFSIIGIVVLIILLCYFSSVLYIFLAVPNNIPAKLTVWGFMSDDDICGLYKSASAEIEIQGQEERVYGINISEEGYFLTMSKYFSTSDQQVSIYTQNGSIYGGEVVFLDNDFNLAVVKCKDSISLPYVNVGEPVYDMSYIFPKTYYVVTSPSVSSKYYTTKQIGEEYLVYLSDSQDGLDVVKTVIEDCVSFGLKIDNLDDGAILDDNGNLIGLVFGGSGTENGNYFYYYYQPVNLMADILTKIKSQNLQTSHVQAVHGFDMEELDCYINLRLPVNDEISIYFDGEWMIFSKNLKEYRLTSSGFYLTQPFVYNESTINQGYVITSVYYKQKTYNISTKVDLFTFLYNRTPGDEFVINCYDIENKTGTIKATVKI